MEINNKYYHSVWGDFKNHSINCIDQRKLPFIFEILELKTMDDLSNAISTMAIRGAPAIGIAAAYGIWLSHLLRDGNKNLIKEDYKKLINLRPTAVNLKRGADFVYSNIKDHITNERVYKCADQFAKQEINACYQIGVHGVELIKNIYKTTNKQVNILTHCNAGWLACGDYGTALAPLFEAQKQGIPIHVWVDETRPLNQGSRLTAWELDNANIPFTIIADNTGALLMMNNKVEIVIVGADRIAKNGDVANKIGTYLKALAAKQHNIPFIVAAPSSTFDFNITDRQQIPIE